jgi:ATP-dependent exoDNAse (exonuclease V) beta subunit
MKGITLINASAGSGKTHNLTNRIVEKLCADVTPENLMATTFTNKAASELRERIRLKLLACDKSREAQQIFDGFIGTVNSICGRLLKEYALDAGLSPSLGVLDEEDGVRLFDMAIASVADKHADAIESVARRLGRDGGGTGYQKRPDWRADVKKIVDLARANLLDSQDLQNCSKKSWESFQKLLVHPCSNGITARFEKEIRTAIGELEKIATPMQKTQKSLDVLKEFVRSSDKGRMIPWVDWIRISKLETNRDGEGILDDLTHIALDVFKHPDFHNDLRLMIEEVFKCASDGLEVYDEFKKRNGLMDFIDQEAKILKLAQKNDAFRMSMSERLKQIMVDEFQDTSPIQLALFLALNDLVKSSIWVGDPKQAIYGFRGTDPQLMDEATKLIPTSDILNKSWRSRETLVKFCNAVFTEVFHEMGKEKVCLSIPDERKKRAKDGWLESWHLNVKNNQDEAISIAIGVKGLLSRVEDIKPSDIAVLCRKNDSCSEIAKELEKLGIRASTGQGSLFQARECQLALAALRYMNNKEDTVALTEIVHLSPRHAHHGQWLALLVKEKRDALIEWKKDPLIISLDQARENLMHSTPLEALETAIDRIQLIHTLKSWPNPQKRMSNLDLLRGICCQYLDQCHTRRAAASITGFISYLQDKDLGQAQGTGDQTVQVLTYHSAKGLEWPVVILSGLDTASKGSAFGINVVASKKFDPANPLANRSIRFWPWPFSNQSNVAVIDDKLSTAEEEICAEQQAKKESQRLLYVGMTRARDRLIFVMRKNVTAGRTVLKTAWLDELTGTSGGPLLKWPMEVGKKNLGIGGASFPIEVLEFSAQPDGAAADPQNQVNYLTPITGIAMEQFPAHLSPSHLKVEDQILINVAIKLVERFDHRIQITSQVDAALLGNAIHGFLATDFHKFSTEHQFDIAKGLLMRWGIDHAVDPRDFMTAGSNLNSFIDKYYPKSKILKEWPVTLRNNKGQILQGWIDMLLETPEGYVLMDHKSYSGDKAEEHVRQYVAQLSCYKEGIELAIGKKVIATLLHLPVIGAMFSVG